MNPLTWLRGRAEAVTGGLPVFPLVMLTTLFFFDEFDTAAFNVLAPNIKRAFDLTDTAFGLLVVANLTVVLLVAVPVGHYGDRLPRRKLVVA
ncbi:MAG: branched-chain amino acid transport system ATP-binding protein livF, partial [Actinomycetota bacterium]